MLASLLLGIVLCQYAAGDVYFHMFRGSNNRLNEPTQNRRNANRVFDSQNNNKGGYNVGDRTVKKFKDTGRTAATQAANQYNMEFYESTPGAPSKLRLEWTNQHGCGGDEDTNPHKLNCNKVLQFMCQPDVDTNGPDTIRNGVNTNTNGYQNPGSKESESQFKNRKSGQNKYGKGNSDDSRGMHERFEWYDKCTQRERNKGLFIADQDLRQSNRQRAINTRQNPGGTRRGYECPEERDYYPYWHPTPWKDVLVLANNASDCSYYQSESFNVKPKHECVEKWSSGNAKHYSRHNNEKDCKANGGEWLEFHNFLEKAAGVKSESACKAKGYIWGRPIYGYNKECLVPLAAPKCQQAMWTRVNHLGNSAGDLQTPSFMWEIPHFPSDDVQRCAFRLRYNISTDDYDPWNTDWKMNGDKGYAYISNDPKVDIGASNEELQLNINTAQTGRTFQDRSHMFKILPRPQVAIGKTIHNVMVRGKRGNIVQTFPAVEYDFTPTQLNITEGELVQFQWTGSNSHNNGGGGDGQAGDDGEGTGGTDRNNVVSMPADRGMNFPVLSESSLNMFANAEVVHVPESLQKLNPKGYKLTPEDVYIQHASSGHYSCGVCDTDHSLKKKATKEKQNNQDNGTLNQASPSFPGILMAFKKGNFNYLCTRNNNFSNRSQKGTLRVK